MKLLASDYDGTLRYAEDVMPEDIEAIKKWKEAGNMFVLVTGRSYESIEVQIKKMGIDVDYVITNNGGMVFDGNGKVLSKNYLNYDSAVLILSAVKGNESIISYVVNDGIHRHRIILKEGATDHRYKHLQPDWTEEYLLDNCAFAQIVLSCDDTHTALEIADKINTMIDSVVAYPNNFVVDVVPAGVSKATGMEFVSGYSGVDEKDIYTIGDGYNDIPLMEYGMNGYVMFTADEEVKMHAQKEYNSIHELIEELM